jgi:hypothetical protein
MNAITGVVLFTVYFLPTFVALKREHKNAGAIIALDILLGWTFLGWVISLVWALTDYTKPPTQISIHSDWNKG